jgi:6-pyruvoyltetrahydropterin/6-carboxytetrahydropterin synthase
MTTTMTFQVCKRAAFSSAHQLPRHPGKCSRLHGHNYVVEVFARGELNDQGMVVDFYDVGRDLRELIVDRCDHRNLNDVYPGMDTTAENLAARWLAELRARDDRYFRVRVWETDTSFAEAELTCR